jgi:hypothetical protein
MGYPGGVPKWVYMLSRELLYPRNKGVDTMKSKKKQKEKLMKLTQKNREKKIRKLMKETNWGRKEAEQWINYTESVDKKTIERMINS